MAVGGDASLGRSDMPQKWSFFAIGVMAGIIAVLGVALLTQAQQAKAVATAPQDSDPAHGILMATGGSQQNMNDICWVLYKRDAPKGAGGDTGTTDGVMTKDKYLSLACYQVANNGRNMKLVDVRNISWDLDLISLRREQTDPTVADIIKALREEAKKKKDKDK
jgi:hypothetical protein